MRNYFKDQRGVVPVLTLLGIVGVIAFLLIASTVGFKDKLFSEVYPKPDSEAATPGGGVTLALLPSQVSVAPGGSFSLDVSINANGDSVTAAQVQVNFDPNFVQPTQVVAGSFLPQVLAPGAVSANSASITLGASPASPAKGSGVVATIHFKALDSQVQSTSISLDPDNTLVAVIGKEGDAAGDLQPALVTIGDFSSPIPVPSPSVTPPPSPRPPPQSPSPSPDSWLMFEAETMSLVPNSRVIQVFSDPLASNGSGLVFLNNATANGSFTTNKNTSLVVVRARGDQCKGAPTMVVKVDNVQISRKALSVSAIGWTDYNIPRNLTPGPHTISLSFNNDETVTKGNRCDRNLRIDNVTIR